MESTAESEVGSHAGTIDLTGNGPTATENHPDSSRRYGGPLIHQHKFTIASCIVAFGLIAVAVGLSASSLQKSNEALALSEINTEAIESEKFIIVNGNEVESGGGGANTPPAPIVTPDPTPNPTPKPSNAATAEPTESPTEPHPLNPQWFQTTHADYQMAAENMAEVHSWHIADNMCVRQNLQMCGLDAYCPNGKGNDPFNGGPPQLHNWSTEKETQWAPFAEYGTDGVSTGVDQEKHWVQIGHISASDGGTDENDFAKCYSHEDWYSGGGEDIEDVWEEEHRMWILCCERPIMV